MEEKEQKRTQRWVMSCELCGRKKSCSKVHGLLICNQCINVITATKNTPGAIRKAWEQFGPGGDLPEAPAAIVDFDHMMDVIDVLDAVKGVLKDKGCELTPHKEKEIAKFLYTAGRE